MPTNSISLTAVYEKADQLSAGKNNIMGAHCIGTFGLSKDIPYNNCIISCSTAGYTRKALRLLEKANVLLAKAQIFDILVGERRCGAPKNIRAPEAGLRYPYGGLHVRIS